MGGLLFPESKMIINDRGRTWVCLPFGSVDGIELLKAERDEVYWTANLSHRITGVNGRFFVTSRDTSKTRIAGDSLKDAISFVREDVGYGY